MGFKEGRTTAVSKAHLLEFYYMESGISEIKMWLNLSVSASSELGKVLEEGSLVAFIKRMLGQDKMGKEYEKNVLHKPDSQGGGSD